MNSTRKMNRKAAGLFLLLAGITVFGLAGSEWYSRPVQSKKSLNIAAEAAILLDAQTGKVIFEKNANAALPPASMSKMMTELLVLDRVNDGLLKWSDKIKTSRYAADAPGAQIGFGPGESWTVRELFEATTVHSANDAAIALAEHIGGTEKKFVRMMNERGKEIGLSDKAVFGNATGLSMTDLVAFPEASASKETELTAKDTAKLAYYLISKYPEVLEVTARDSVKLTSSDARLQTTNMMLSGKPFAYPGNDGLKTGYTERAGYCFTGTAKVDGKRLITVVMGAGTADARFEETQKLLHYGFQTSKFDSWKIDMSAKIGLIAAAAR
ncbi:D-alanyl-D-alanine carboxypeptidase family protein [Paenibacillus sp. NPDC058174]|uniref:D-alanyl-D-alanine carboxypeptidase family protein n=1 Tax=Paenibacillus sp. NPDC058174 TaxID=3346366 RepID=UPI0036DB911F